MSSPAACNENNWSNVPLQRSDSRSARQRYERVQIASRGAGGADIVRQLMQNHLIDQYHISIIPMILGNGIRLFDVTDQKTDLRLITAKNSNGIVELVYQKR